MSDARPVTVRVPVRIDFAGGWTDVHYFSAKEGGAVLNAAINHFVEGSAVWGDRQLKVEYGLTIPSGSGLGTSAAIDVAWLALTNALIGRKQSGAELAEAAYRLEKLLGVEGGKQDQYASALGGFNLLHFGAEKEQARVEPLDVPDSVVQELEERCVLCYSGSAHNSGSVHEGVWERYKAGEQEVVSALRDIAGTAEPTREALLAGEVDSLARLVTANRECARRLHPALVTKRMDELFEAGLRAGATGSKACGAGGGGCLLFVCGEGKRGDVVAALEGAAADLIPFKFERNSQLV